MRYFAGFIGGLVVAVLLLVFQQHLIGAEREARPAPPTVITLGSVMKSRPPEHKPYQAKQPPQEPEPLERPVNSADPEPVAVRPTLMTLSRVGTLVSHGEGPRIDWGDGVARADGPAIARVMVAPQYPVTALRDEVEGQVEVEFTILPDGSVTDIRVIRADPPGVFDSSARRAVQRWQFIPRRVNGTAVSMRARQVIEFRLPAGGN